MAWLGYLQKYNSFFVHDSVQWKTLLGIAENDYSLLLSSLSSEEQNLFLWSLIVQLLQTGVGSFLFFFNFISTIAYGLSTL